MHAWELMQEIGRTLEARDSKATNEQPPPAAPTKKTKNKNEKTTRATSTFYTLLFSLPPDNCRCILHTTLLLSTDTTVVVRYTLVADALLAEGGREPGLQDFPPSHGDLPLRPPPAVARIRLRDRTKVRVSELLEETLLRVVGQ